jgi:hypothetical protein
VAATAFKLKTQVRVRNRLIRHGEHHLEPGRQAGASSDGAHSHVRCHDGETDTAASVESARSVRPAASRGVAALSRESALYRW